MPTPLFDKSGGYRRLTSFHFATLIHLGTISFCKRFISFKDDPLGKTTGQMVDAARAGRQNIIEGSERAGTSKETEMKLTDVAKASPGELQGDLEIFLAARGVVPWSEQSSECKTLKALNFPDFHYTDDTLHDFWQWFHEHKKPFMPWLENEDPCVVANTLLVLVRRAMAMLASQTRQQGEAFLESGGFRERLTTGRVEARAAQEDAPACPNCGKAMKRRKGARGEFWGCTGYPGCRGTRETEEKKKDAGPGTQDSASGSPASLL
jgi:four helix bundle suffix protein